MMQGWSVNGVIIALCVAVFVIDGFLGGRRGSNIVIDRTTLEGAVLPPEFAAAKPAGNAIPLSQAAQQWGPGVIAAAQRVRLASKDVWVQPLEQGGNLVGLAFSLRSTPLNAWLHFSTSTALLGDSGSGPGFPQVWRFIGFQFLHANLNHILFNMMTLFFFGGMVEQFLGSKRFLAFYLLCGISGGLMYLLLNGLAIGGQAAFGPGFHLPGLLFNDSDTMLVGASAGVFGVIMAAAYLAPNATVRLYFFIPMRLATLAYGLVALALLVVMFGWANAGGEAAHIGGALAGFWLVRNPAHLHGFFDFFGQYDPTSRVARARVAARRGTVQGGSTSAEVNRILDKISANGLHSLTEAEKRILREASRKSQ